MSYWPNTTWSILRGYAIHHSAQSSARLLSQSLRVDWGVLCVIGGESYERWHNFPFDVLKRCISQATHAQRTSSNYKHYHFGPSTNNRFATNSCGNTEIVDDFGRMPTKPSAEPQGRRNKFTDVGVVGRYFTVCGISLLISGKRDWWSKIRDEEILLA